MITADNIISQTERESLDKSFLQDEEETLFTDSVQPYALTLVDMSDSMNSINASKGQISKLIKSLAEKPNPKETELIIRGTKEVRELLKLKLEMGKFAHVVGGRILGPPKKNLKETV